MSKTKEEKKHLERVASIGCIHFETIPLCPAHHRTGGVGIAFHAAPRTFESLYGTERELLEQVENILNWQ